MDEVIVFPAPAPDAPPLGELLRSIREAVARVLGIQAKRVLVPAKKHQVAEDEAGRARATEMRRRFESGELAA